MLQAYFPEGAYAPFSRLRAWIMALEVEPVLLDASPEKPETEEEESEPDREDVFYLSLGLHGYW